LPAVHGGLFFVYWAHHFIRRMSMNYLAAILILGSFTAYAASDSASDGYSANTGKAAPGNFIEKEGAEDVMPSTTTQNGGSPGKEAGVIPGTSAENMNSAPTPVDAVESKSFDKTLTTDELRRDGTYRRQSEEEPTNVDEDVEEDEYSEPELD
jgi:hypothetical protein